MRAPQHHPRRRARVQARPPIRMLGLGLRQCRIRQDPCAGAARDQSSARGVEPEKILCITFTKAAAANMAKRVFDTLAAGPRSTTPRSMPQSASDRRRRRRATRAALARRLFARALETPGGLKVQTIHAFCTQLLHQFPFEANVAARFSVLDETAQAQLLEQLTLDVLLEGAAEPDSALGRALGDRHDRRRRPDVPRRGARSDRPPRRHRPLGDSAGGVEEAIAGLSQTLGVDPDDASRESNAEYRRRFVAAAVGMAGGRGAVQDGSVRDQEQAERLTRRLNARGTERVEAYLKCLHRQQLQAAQQYPDPEASARSIPIWRSDCARSRRG